MLNTLNWITVMKTKEITKDQEVQDQSKREFLRKSSYAAYMAPAMLTLVVSQQSAAASCISPGNGNGYGNGSCPPGHNRRAKIFVKPK
jgi:hypothetical protein